MSDYRLISSMEEIVDEVTKEIIVDTSTVNLIKRYQISREDIKNNSIRDCTEEASKWASEDTPSDFFFSHGEYRKDGLEYISNELIQKKTTNRAMYSLVSNSMIVDSADKPIPSFMIFQCLFESEGSNTLYCNIYFRALEVSTFFRINLEEIRQNLQKLIEDKVSFEKVNLLIIAARAHHKHDFIPLKKPKIDTLTGIQIHNIVIEKNWQELAKLLREKAKAQSVIQLQSLYHLQESFEYKSNNISSNLKRILIKCIDLSNELMLLRQDHSHSEELNKVSKQLNYNIINMAEEVEKLN